MTNAFRTSFPFTFLDLISLVHSRRYCHCHCHTSSEMIYAMQTKRILSSDVCETAMITRITMACSCLPHVHQSSDLSRSHTFATVCSIVESICLLMSSKWFVEQTLFEKIRNNFDNDTTNSFVIYLTIERRRARSIDFIEQKHHPVDDTCTFD
jgi:hypothetical protein